MSSVKARPVNSLAVKHDFDVYTAPVLRERATGLSELVGLGQMSGKFMHFLLWIGSTVFRPRSLRFAWHMRPRYGP